MVLCFFLRIRGSKGTQGKPSLSLSLSTIEFFHDKEI